MTELICSHDGCGKPLTVYLEDITASRKIIELTDSGDLDIQCRYTVEGDGENPRLECVAVDFRCP
jgi:hypothetical protein